MHILARLWEIPGPQPLTNRLEFGPACNMRAVHSRVTARFKRVALVGACKSAKGNGRIRGTVSRRTDLGNALAKRLRRDGISIDVGELALIGPKAQRRVALDVLDRAIVLAHGKMYIGCRHIVLEIDKGFLAMPFRFAIRNAENASRGRYVWLAGFHIDRRFELCFAEARQELSRNVDRLFEGRLQTELAGNRADTIDPGLGASRCWRHKRKPCLVPHRASAIVTEEMHSRRQPARTAHRITGNKWTVPGDAISRAVQLHEMRAFDRAAAMRLRDAVARHNVNTRRLGTSFPFAVLRAARIGQDHLAARPRKIAGALINMIVARQQQHAPAARHTIAIEIRGQCRCREDARNIVIAEY